jgi:hypothetical protein
VKSATCSVCTLPLLYSGYNRAPWPPYRLHQVPPTHRDCPLPGSLLKSRFRPKFLPGFRRAPLRSASPLRAFRPSLEANDTAFDRFEPVSPDRILSLDATSVPRSGTALPDSAGCLSYVSELCFDFPRLSRFPSSAFTLAGSQQYVGFVTSLTPSRVACSGLQATPADFSATALPDRLPSCVKIPNLLSLLRVAAASSLDLRFGGYE